MLREEWVICEVIHYGWTGVGPLIDVAAVNASEPITRTIKPELNVEREIYAETGLQLVWCSGERWRGSSLLGGGCVAEAGGQVQCMSSALYVSSEEIPGRTNPPLHCNAPIIQEIVRKSELIKMWFIMTLQYLQWPPHESNVPHM